MNKVLATLVLPAAISEFEARYLARMNRIGLVFFALHVPFLAVLAYFNETGPLMAIALSVGVMAGPALAYRVFSNPRVMSLTYGFTAMLMGGLLVHFGQGPVQIEMHFYFFALLAMLVLFANPMAIVVAAVTVAVHHGLLWAALPTSVFNYDAPFWVVAVHAAFVVLEAIAGCFIARSFFDNVIGLEKIVQARTQELDARHRELRLVLDNVQQGLLMLDRDATVGAEHSAVIEQWLGPIPAGSAFADALERIDPPARRWFDVAWTEVVDEIMPLELTLAQLPAKLTTGGRTLEIAYLPIHGPDGRFAKILVVVSDVSMAVERARLEAEQRELMSVLDRLVGDRRGVIEFRDEGSELVARIAADDLPDLALVRRALHTLKGNAGVFGVTSVAQLCHALEDGIDETSERPSAASRQALLDRWNGLSASLQSLLGERGIENLEITPATHARLVRAIRDRRPHEELLHEVESWRLEPTALRLGRVADQARRIATRLGKGDLDVVVDHDDLRLPPDSWHEFWSAFIHVVRNAVDHGIEDVDTRTAAGKPPQGRIVLETHVEGDDLVVAIEDDGRGIDIPGLSAAAARVGLRPQTHDELLDTMFRDGVTTTTTVNEFSGRGVGLGAVEAACRALGGRVLPISQPGVGTRFEFRFPVAVLRATKLAA